VFGASRRLTVGPDAASMTVIAAAITAIIAGMPAASSPDRAAIAAVLALSVGLMCLAASIQRLGVLATFLSRPILAGFFAGISVSILIGQHSRMTGMKVESDGLLASLLELTTKMNMIHWPTVVLTACMFGVLIAAKAVRSPVQGPVIVVVLAVVDNGSGRFRAWGPF
jgi:SulP family sulfate permease